ncbi:hypothetical protein SO802_003207 [Lithocarpus litseifolius]|uniref:Aminotransferase-like plant mobile domain-containing protein n=1 Tax=Lithocarpus litseifolius TaxID=425828 RepID=A0AAW2E2X4_9ROSI
MKIGEIEDGDGLAAWDGEDIFEMEPGPFDPSLLTQQQYHISNDVMEVNDIAIITGLPIDGNVVCGPTNLDWGIVCQNLLGVRPPATTLDYSANVVTIQQYAMTYTFQVLALLFGNKSQRRLHCYFLQLLADFGDVGECSWGSATLVVGLEKAWRFQALFSYYNYGPGSIFPI